MKRKLNKKGFTLLEVIIVVIIVGVLASLALPRLFASVDFSRSTEALNSMIPIRKALEECYMLNNQDYQPCDDFAVLTVEDPGNSPGASFSYAITSPAADTYSVVATLNSDAASKITIMQNATTVSKTGSGVFSQL